MAGKANPIIQVFGLSILWIAIAIAGAIFFGNAINGHTDLGFITAVVVVVAGLILLAVVGHRLVRIVRKL